MNSLVIIIDCYLGYNVTPMRVGTSLNIISIAIAYNDTNDDNSVEMKLGNQYSIVHMANAKNVTL